MRIRLRVAWLGTAWLGAACFGRTLPRHHHDPQKLSVLLQPMQRDYFCIAASINWI
jgi:hypothetical protein